MIWNVKMGWNDRLRAVSPTYDVFENLYETALVNVFKIATAMQLMLTSQKLNNGHI